MDSINPSLVHGKEYSMAELFANDHRKIIIPDFQRDYCWGDKNYGDKKDTDIVSGFVQTLKDEYKNGMLVLGKIDVYQNPTNHIYLTDGQQRLTTIYLLIGMLHKISTGDIKNRLRKCLISDYEEKDDKEPYLQYSIRESSVFFLRDLVNEFFIECNSQKVTDIETQPWFFNDYWLDPTISSMRKALESIESALTERELNIQDFSSFVLDNLKIQYFDVNDRKHGEERFVIINTTGKSLTTTENIKPILLGSENSDINYQQWEERETYFWTNRRKEKSNEELVADKGVGDFMTWCFQIIENQDDIDLNKKSKEYLKNKKTFDIIEEVNKLFHSLKILIDLLLKENIQEQIKFINEGKIVNNIVGLRSLTKERNQNILLPLLSFIKEFNPNEKDVYQFLRRLRKNYFDLKRKERNKNYVDWRYILQFIEFSDNPQQVLQFTQNENHDLKIIPNIELNEWFSSEERIKVILKNDHNSEIEKWEDHTDFMGDISFLFKIDKKNNGLNTDLNFERLIQYWLTYCKLDDCLHEEKITEVDYALSNYYRLYRVFIGCQLLGHIDYCSSDIEGCLFSSSNLNHFSKDRFLALCSMPQDELLSEIRNDIYLFIKEDNLFELTEENFDVKRFLKAWLALKVIQAEKMEILLSFWDGNGIAAYININQNKLNKLLPFSLANAICGYAIKSPANRIEYADKYWLNSSCFDTIFDGISLSQFNDKEKTPINLDANGKIVNQLISDWLNSMNDR